MYTLDKYKDQLSILVVDDNEDNLFTLTRRLKKEGYTNYITVNNGKDALARTKDSKIDLVLLDLLMPDINGDEVLKQIKSDKATNAIMVLMISGDDRTENIAECIRLGAEDFLQKPFNVDILKARIGGGLRKKYYAEQEKDYLEKIEFEKQQSVQLLEATFPGKIIEELTKNGKVAPLLYKNTAVIFTDISGFTNYCSKHSPKEVFDNMQAYVNLCEKLSEKHGLEKIKTIGDAFMATGGMFVKTANPVLASAAFALDLLKERKSLPTLWDIHIGIDYGDVIAGIIGHSKYLFDVWGDTVNVAARIQDVAKANSVCISKNGWEKIKNKSTGKSIGKFDLKGKGEMELYEVTAIKTG